MRASALSLHGGRGGRGVLPMPRARAVSTCRRVRQEEEGAPPRATAARDVGVGEVELGEGEQRLRCSTRKSR